MTPPMGITKWKTIFFYIKVAAVVAKMTFRNVNGTILAESIEVPRADTVDWFPRLWTIEFKKLDKSQLWVLRIMLTRPSRKARPVVQEKSGGNVLSKDAVLWRIFNPDFKGKVEILACVEGEEGFNLTIRDNFRIPDRDAMKAPLPQGKVLGDFNVKGAPKKQMEKTVRVVIGKYLNPQLFLLCSRTWQDLGVPGGGAAAGGSSVGSKPADEKKRKVEEKAAGAGGKKRPRLQTKQTTAVSQTKPAVVAEPSVEEEDVGEKTAYQIFDTVDSHDNLIPPKDNPNLKFADAEKQKSPAAEKASGSASGGTGFEGPSIQPRESELEFYYRTYTEDRSVNYHRPHWNVMQGDDTSTDPSTCRDILSGLGTPFKVFRARGLPREHLINQLSSMLVGNSIMANVIMED
ncbi:hypothetical protein Hanom_Chr00s000003g01603081 [Helianthus anomalus]